MATGFIGKTLVGFGLPVLNMPRMIIACPACATRYAIPDDAIGMEGRVVRCAKCRHSWHQHGEALPEPAVEQGAAPITPAPPPAHAAPPQPQDEAAAQPTSAPVEPPSFSPAEPAADNDGFDESPSSFDHTPPFRPRRRPARLWTILAVILCLLLLGAIAAVAQFGLPAWAQLANTPFAATPPDLVLAFPANRQDRRTLPNGAQYFGISGTITNVGRERRTVPPILIRLRDDHNRVVYNWDVAAPRPVLAPGESVPVIEAATDIPKSAKYAEIRWKPS